MKNEIFNLAPVVNDWCVFTGITPWDAPNNNPLPSKLEDDVPWELSRMNVQKRLQIQDQVFTGTTTPWNKYHDGGILLYTGIATGITPRKNEWHENADYLAKITPRKNGIFNLAPVVNDRCVLTGITPWDAPNNDPLPSKLEDDVPWEISRMNVQKRLQIQDQVLKYLHNRKSARTQPTPRTPVRSNQTEQIPSVTINISLQKNVTVKTMANSPGKPLCLQETKEFDNLAGTQFVMPIITDNSACTITALAYAVREPGRPPGENTNFTLYDQPRIDNKFQTIGSNSNFTIKTNSNQAQEYSVRLIWLISRISINFQMILNNLVSSFLTSLNQQKAILQKLFLVFK